MVTSLEFNQPVWRSYPRKRKCDARSIQDICPKIKVDFPPPRHGRDLVIIGRGNRGCPGMGGIMLASLFGVLNSVVWRGRYEIASP
jgi:hypothetical protein